MIIRSLLLMSVWIVLLPVGCQSVSSRSQNPDRNRDDGIFVSGPSVPTVGTTVPRARGMAVSAMSSPTVGTTVPQNRGMAVPAMSAPTVGTTVPRKIATVSFEEEQSVPGMDPVTEQHVLTLADLEGIAFQSNPTLAAATARWQAAQGREVQAGLYPNPVIGYHATEISNLGTAGQQGGFIGQKIITGGKLHLDRAIAGKEAEAVRFSLQAQEKRVVTDVRLRYYEVLVAQRRVELTKQLVDIGDNLVEATQTLLKGRQGTENDLLQAQIRAEQARILHDNAGNDHIEAWQRLVTVIGVPTLSMKPVLGDPDAHLPNYTWEDCRQLVLNNHPELNAALTRVHKERIAIVRARKEPIPNVDVFVSVRHHNVTESEVANVQVGIPIPIFNRNQGNIRAAESDWIAAQKEVGRIELQLMDRLAKTFRRYANAHKQVDRYRQGILPGARKSLELVSRGYTKGQVEYLMLLTAQETYVNTNLAYLTSLLNLRTSVSEMEGQLLSESLAKLP